MYRHSQAATATNGEPMRSEAGENSSSAEQIHVRSERDRACMHFEPHQAGIKTLRPAHHCTLYAEHCTLATLWHFIDVTTFQPSWIQTKKSSIY